MNVINHPHTVRADMEGNCRRCQIPAQISSSAPMEEAHGESQWVRHALIRARHPHTGEVYGAGPIIDAANKLDMHHILDQKARKTAIREAALLREMRGRIFINFMPNTIYDPEICLRTTMEAAHEYGVPLSRLVFEVVETEQIPDMKKLERILDYYRRHGAGTAVDDMGAGYASVEYLAALQPDFVKIDRDCRGH